MPRTLDYHSYCEFKMEAMLQWPVHRAQAEPMAALCAAFSVCGGATASALVSNIHPKPWFLPASPLSCRGRRLCGHVAIGPPPEDFDYRAESETARTIEQMYPELLDLVEDGSIVVVKRPSDYVERRSDGYVEPEMIVVVGMTHVSSDSASHVERVVKAVRPENVVVELCRSRAGMMYSTKVVDSTEGKPEGVLETNLFSLGGEGFLSAMRRSLNLGGQSALALRLLLAGLSQKISSTAGMPIGDEFRAARKAAKEIGAQIILGDRPIEITLERAWQSLRWNEQLRLIGTLIQAINSPSLDLSEESLKNLKKDDALSIILGELGMFYPSLLQPLIYERDVYLAWSLKRSKAVNGSKKVVGIIGRGHLRGIVYALKHNQDSLRFRDLVGGKRTKDDNRRDWIKMLLGGFIRDIVFGVLVWLLLEQLKNRF